MFKESYNVNNYINSLFYSTDLETEFSKTDLSVIYKNKYERLSKTLPDVNAHTINVAYMIIDDCINTLENYCSLNNKRILLFRKFYNNLSYDRLIFNSSISLSFLEMIIDDPNEWNDIVTNIRKYTTEYNKYIHDDSNNSHRILTITIPIIEYSYSVNIPDIIDYNPMITLSYYDIFEDIPIIDDSIKDMFTSELKYLINTNKINKDKFYTELLEYCVNLDIYEDSINNIRFICRELISYMNNDNLHLILHLQFRILEKIFNNNLYSDPDFESMLIKKLTTIMSIDIAVYNKSLNIDNIELLKLLLLTYNYCIIAIQDMIDRFNNDLNGKKISMFMYKSQLFKSRNKLQERMDNICQK